MTQPSTNCLKKILALGLILLMCTMYVSVRYERNNFTYFKVKYTPKGSIALPKNSNKRTTDLETFCPKRTTLTGLCQKGFRLSDPPRCVMSINVIGRLGNTMGQYATLYALAQWNGRPAFMLPEMASVLRKHFKVTMPSLDSSAAACLQTKWTRQWIHDWMDESYRTLPGPLQQPLMLTGYPFSWTFFDHIRESIRREFRFHDHVAARAQRTLRELLGNRREVTFVGVHVRRSDYVQLMASSYKGVVADADYLSRATAYFRSRYDDAIFVVASDDMVWCRANLDASRGDVHFAGSGNVSDPISDMVLLSQCNHSIVTFGTYGFWSAYLAGGETVHMTNFTLPDSPLLTVLHYEDAYLPEWIPMAANLSSLMTTSPKTSTSAPVVALPDQRSTSSNESIVDGKTT